MSTQGLKQAREKTAWKAALEMIHTLQKWIRDNDKRDVHLHLARKDQLRLLKIRSWALRHYLSEQDVLDILVPKIRYQVKARGVKRAMGLGIAVAALVGPGAYEILTSELKKRYPNCEHITLWKDAERQRQLAREQDDDVAVRSPLTILETATAKEYVNRYKCRVLGKRDEAESELANRQRQRKNYRWNPWGG